MNRATPVIHPVSAQSPKPIARTDARVGLDSRMRQAIRILLFAVVGFGAGNLRADFEDSFESPQASWSVGSRDCAVLQFQQTRDFQAAHSGQASEAFRFQAGQGTRLEVVYSLSPTPVIDELVIGVWIKSDRKGMRLRARVLLPRSAENESELPRYAWLEGESYRDVGTWQRLTLTLPARQLQSSLPVLRSEFGPELSVKEAQIDQVVLNIYGGTGSHQVWLDDLSVTGQVARATSGGWHGSSNAGETTAGRALEIQGRQLINPESAPVFLRCIEYRGETLAYLKSLGFNSILTSEPLTPPQQLTAKELGLFVIQGLRSRGSQGLPAEAAPKPSAHWITVEELQASATDALDSLTSPCLMRINQHPCRLPPQCDLVVLPAFHSHDAFELAECGKRWADRLRQNRWPVPHAIEIETNVPWIWRDQVERLAQQPLDLSIDDQMLRQVTFQALATGPRALFFRSSDRLDRTDAATRKRALALERINIELSLLDPWLKGATLLKTATASHPAFRVYQFQTERSSLVLTLHEADSQQFAMPPITAQSVQLELVGVPITDEAYRIRSDGLHRQPRLPQRKTTFELRQPERVNLMLVTQDALALRYISQQASQTSRRLRELEHSLLWQRYEETSHIIGHLERMGRVGESFNEILGNVKRDLELFERSPSGTPAAQGHAMRRQVTHRLDEIRHHTWAHAQHSFPAGITNPMVHSFLTIPWFWASSRRWVDGPWSSNLLSGGDLEVDTPFLKSLGWSFHSQPNELAPESIEIRGDSPRGGLFYLRMQVPADSEPMLVSPQDAPLMLETPPVALLRGHTIMVQGWIRIHTKFAMKQGVWIWDSLTGSQLAHQEVMPGEWRRFTIIRSIPFDTDYSLRVSLTEPGRVDLDDLAIVVLQEPNQLSKLENP